MSIAVSLFYHILLMWTIFKVFMEFVSIATVSYVWVIWPGGMRDLSSPTTDQTRTPQHWKAQS